MTAQAGATLDPKPEWQSIDWKPIESAVRRLQARIVKAVQQGRWNKAKALLPAWTTHITEGFDFLGQHVRRYPNGKLFIKRARKSIRSLLIRVEEIVREHHGSRAHRLIARLNPVIRGWANYHCHVVAKRIFAQVDADLPHAVEVGASPPSA